MSDNVSCVPKVRITPELIKEVERLLPTCLFTATFCDVTGVPRRSFYRWLHEGKKLLESDKPTEKLTERERLVVRFVLAVNASRARAELRDLAIIEIASAKNWRAAAWRLARAFPSKWSQHRAQLKLLHQEINKLDRYLSGCDAHAPDRGQLEQITSELEDMRLSLAQKPA